METSPGRGHVASVSREKLVACEYAYDATGLLARVALPGQTGERFWRGKHAVNELRTSASGSAQLTWLRALGQPIVEQVSGAVTRMTLLATAISGSVLLEADTAVRQVAYAPHGSRPDGKEGEGAAQAEPAFNGELLDAASGCYLLGAGHHRPYSPRLGIFLAADGLSPFGVGGLNPYAYCAGDPVNRSDPTGHFWKWIVAAVGLAVGVAAVAVTFGAASKAVAALATVGISALTKSTAGAIASTTLGVVAVGAEVGAIAAGAAGDTKTATILGFVGLALGIVAAAPAIAKAATKGAARLSRFSRRIGSTRSHRVGGNLGQRTFDTPLASGVATVPGAARRTTALSDETMAMLVEARRRHLMGSQHDFGGPVVPGDSPAQPYMRVYQRNADRIAELRADSRQRFSLDTVDEHIQTMNEAVPEVVRPSRAVRRAAGVKPPSYDDATLPTYTEATSPPSYDSHGFT